MDAKEIFKKVRKLEISTKGLVNNLFGGEYHSAFKGSGMAFSEVREYQYGDDVRMIDWNVTAKTGSPYIKVFEEEREQTLMLCVDISPSEVFGSKNQRKMDLSIEICAVLAFSAISNGDKVGLLLFTDRIEKVVLPRKGKQHVLRLIRDLYSAKPEGKGTDVSIPLDFVNRMLKRRSIVVMASDFHSKDFDKAMKITNRKHDLVNLFINDQYEYDLPNVGIVPIRDAETGRTVVVDTGSKKLRDAYSKRRRERHQKLLDHFLKLHVDTVDVQTNESYIEPLRNFFIRRLNRY